MTPYDHFMTKQVIMQFKIKHLQLTMGTGIFKIWAPNLTNWAPENLMLYELH